MKGNREETRNVRETAGQAAAPLPQEGRFEIRTDLAVEKREDAGEASKCLSGVSLKEWYPKGSGVKLTRVEIKSREGERAMGKAMGTYITLEADQLAVKDKDYHRRVSEELADQLAFLAEKKKRSVCHVLVVGLGNPSVTPDSLGPKVAGNLCVTRHMDMEYGAGFLRDRGLTAISGIVPGVMAQTGMETAEIVRGVIRETCPDLIIAIDALAAKSVRRLGTTIQLTDTGIHPGSGVGNHRCGLTEESLGVPVLAVGVPTVVGAAAIVQDTVQAMVKALEASEATARLGTYLEELDGEEQYRLIRELLEPEFGPMYVTPPDIDETVKEMSFTISEAIHRAFLGAGSAGME